MVVFQKYKERSMYPINPYSVALPLFTKGNILSLDASNPLSYPKSGNTWYDVSGLNNNATLFNGVIYSSENNGVMSFDGIDDYASIPSNIVLNPDVITISFWVNKKNLQGQQGNVVSNNFNSNYRVQVQVLYIAFYNMGVNNNITALADNDKWIKVDCVGDSSGLKIYINSILSASNSSPYIKGVNSNLLLGIGRFTGGKERLDGFVNDINIYNYAMTSAQISDNFNSQRNKYNV